MQNKPPWNERVTGMDEKWRKHLDRDKKSVAKISRFLAKLEAEREANPGLINDPAYWDKAEQGIRALTWINNRPIYLDDNIMNYTELAAFDQQLHDLIRKARRALFTGSSAETEMKELQRHTWADWDLVGIKDEFDIWLEQELDTGEQRHLEERRRGRVSPTGKVR